MRVKMFALVVGVLRLPAPAIAIQVPAPPSRFEIAGCTMECCGYGTWRAKTRTIAFVKRDTTSAEAFIIEPNDSVVAASGIVAMQHPGIVTAAHSRTLASSRIGNLARRGRSRCPPATQCTRSSRAPRPRTRSFGIAARSTSARRFMTGSLSCRRSATDGG